MSDVFKFDYIQPENIILNKNKDTYGTFIDGTKSGITLRTLQQPTDITIRSDFYGGNFDSVIAVRQFNINQLFGESINYTAEELYVGDEIVIYRTGFKFTGSFSEGPFIRLGRNNIISEKSNSKLGIGTLFPAEKVHISGGNLRVEDFIFAKNLIYNTGNQTISGLKFFVIRPQVNGTGVLLSGEAYPSNNPSGFITGIDTSSFYPRSNPSGFITGVDLSPYATVTNLNLTGSNLQNQINNLNNTYATDAELSGVNNTLNTKINSLSGAAVLLYGDQTIDGTKTFRNSVYIHDLYVTGTEFIANVENNFIESPYILLNLTGGATDGGIFFVTGSGLTGINDYGPIIGFDHTDKFKFGIARRSGDLSVLNDIAAVQDITNYSGFANNSFYLKSNPSGFITGIDLSAYAQIQQLNDLQPDEGGIIVLYAGGLWDSVSNNLGFNIQDGDLIIYKNGSPIAGITPQYLTSYRNYILPNSDGTIALISNVNATGLLLNQKIDNLSGYSTGTFATINNLNLTGSTLQQNIDIVSGNLAVTGQNLQSQIDDLSVKSIAYAIALG